MDYLVDKRKYQRCSNLICKVFVSNDEKSWNTVDLVDISAGGMKFFSIDMINDNSKLYFQLYVYNMLSEFNLRLEAQVIRFDKKDTGSTYSVKFLEMSKYYQIQLDELVKSKVSVAESNKFAYEQDNKHMVHKKKGKIRGLKIHF